MGLDIQDGKKQLFYRTAKKLMTALNPTIKVQESCDFTGKVL